MRQHEHDNPCIPTSIIPLVRSPMLTTVLNIRNHCTSVLVTDLYHIKGALTPWSYDGDEHQSTKYEENLHNCTNCTNWQYLQIVSSSSLSWPPMEDTKYTWCIVETNCKFLNCSFLISWNVTFLRDLLFDFCYTSVVSSFIISLLHCNEPVKNYFNFLTYSSRWTAFLFNTLRALGFGTLSNSLFSNCVGKIWPLLNCLWHIKIR